MGFINHRIVENAINSLMVSGPGSQQTNPILYLFSFLRAKKSVYKDESSFQEEMAGWFGEISCIQENIFFEPFNLTSHNQSRGWRKGKNARDLVSSNFFSTYKDAVVYPSKRPLLQINRNENFRNATLHKDWLANLQLRIDKLDPFALMVFLLRTIEFEKQNVSDNDFLDKFKEVYGEDLPFAKSYVPSTIDTAEESPAQLLDLQPIKRELAKQQITPSETTDTAIREFNKEMLSKNLIVYGIPGSGKSYYVKHEYCKNNHTEVTVFHPDYSAADFIGQIMPSIEKGLLKYSFHPGPFARALKWAVDNSDEQCVLVIEEINRGNAAAIFGSIFLLLDRNEYGESEYAINDPTLAEYVYGDCNHKIKIPNNLALISTMNSSDQNVYPLDTAFQRRWEMEMVKNDKDKCPFASELIDGTNTTWAEFVTVINGMIHHLGLSEDKRIGYFFVKESDLSNKNLFAQKVIKYLWDDAFKYERGYFTESLRDPTLEDLLNFVQNEDEWLRIFNDWPSNK